MAKTTCWVKKWSVASHTDYDTKYTVALKYDGTYGCSCKAWIFQRKRLPNGHCKHIEGVIAVDPMHTVQNGTLKFAFNSSTSVRFNTADWMIDVLGTNDKLIYVPAAAQLWEDDRE